MSDGRQSLTFDGFEALMRQSRGIAGAIDRAMAQPLPQAG